ncbi:MAG: MBL fold metallo-hydrolase, partial [Acidobacteriota bacterium]
RKQIGRDDHECDPLYSMEDAEQTFRQFDSVPLQETREISPGLKYTTFEAGHMLGSTSMVVEADGVRLGFSGDVGRKHLPILRDPVSPEKVDYLIMESTYGNRTHDNMTSAEDKLADVVSATAARGGRLIIPCFAVGRTQQIVLMLHELILARRIPSLPIFVDSPLAINATVVFRNHPECYDEEVREFLTQVEDPFGFSRLRYVRDAAESKTLNDLRGPFIVLAASGMCEAGRILHHLRNGISDPRNTVLITGYQAEHTLGKKILEKHSEVPIFGEPVRLRARVEVLNELSGHADQGELLTWLKPMVPTLKKVFLVHGDPTQSLPLAEKIKQEFKIDAVVPSRGDSFDLV